jgi:hypothetical protein
VRYRNLLRVGNTLFVDTQNLNSNVGQTLAFNVDDLLRLAEAHNGRLDTSIGRENPDAPPPEAVTPKQIGASFVRPISSTFSWIIDTVHVSAGR